MTLPNKPSHYPKRFFCTLDGIRGLAAILVAMSHTLVFLNPITLNEAHLAVDIFFLLSGVVLANAYEQRLLAGLGTWRFIVIRVIRIYPLYLLGCLITILSLASGIGSQEDAAHLFLFICLAVFILPNPIIGNEHIFPLNAPSWSLFFELAANVAYAAFIRTLTTAHLLGIIFISAIGIVLGLYLGHTHTLNIGWTLKGLPFGLFRVGYSFFGGVLLYRIFRSGHLPVTCATAVRSWVPLLLFAIVALVLTSSPPAALVPYVELAAVTIVFPVLVYLALWFEPETRTARVFTFLGGISYPLYAVHFPLATFTKEYFKQIIGTPVQTYAPYGGVCLILSLMLLAWMLDKLCDTPLRRALMKRLI
ncbi:MAG: acyltransferase family protein [Gemmataceae bacterium]